MDCLVLSYSPAKIILLGEHSVVYGEPAIAIPVTSLLSSCCVSVSTDFVIELVDLGEDFSLFDVSHPLVDVFRLFVSFYGLSVSSKRFRLSSEIPVASGLGSGASVSAAFVNSLYQCYCVPYDYAKINEFVYFTEQHHHGTPSGIDNTVIVYQKPIYYIRGQEPRLITINPNRRFTFLIGNTGISAPTKRAVADVRSLYATNTTKLARIINEMGKIADESHEIIKNGDVIALGSLLNRNHTLLQQLTVSSPKLDKLVDAARAAGALGAKLSGGGRGGNMIALVTDESKSAVRKALLEAGAIAVYETDMTTRSEDESD